MRPCGSVHLSSAHIFIPHTKPFPNFRIFFFLFLCLSDSVSLFLKCLSQMVSLFFLLLAWLLRVVFECSKCPDFYFQFLRLRFLPFIFRRLVIYLILDSYLINAIKLRTRNWPLLASWQHGSYMIETSCAWIPEKDRFSYDANPRSCQTNDGPLASLKASVGKTLQ